MNIAVKIAAASDIDVDVLGALKAQIADLEAEAQILIDALKARGAGSYEGELFEANVADVAGNEAVIEQRPDPVAMKAKLELLGIDGRWFAKNMVDVVVKPARKDSVRLTVKARK